MPQPNEAGFQVALQKFEDWTSVSLEQRLLLMKLIMAKKANIIQVERRR